MLYYRLLQVFLPYWMMQNLLLSEGDEVELRSILRPPAGSFVRFRPHDEAFFDVAAQQVLHRHERCLEMKYEHSSEYGMVLTVYY